MKLKLSKITMIVVTVFLIVLAIVLNLYLQPRFTASSPKNGEKNVNPTSKITLTFNKEMKTPGLVTSGTGLIFIPIINGDVRAEGNDIIITPQTPLSANQRYSITLADLTTSSGDVVKTRTITFTTASYSTTETTTKKANFLKTLPITNNRYSLDYIGAVNTFSVDISEGREEEIKREIESLLANNGFDPSQTKVTYYLQPTAGGVGGP